MQNQKIDADLNRRFYEGSLIEVEAGSAIDDMLSLALAVTSCHTAGVSLSNNINLRPPVERYIRPTIGQNPLRSTNVGSSEPTYPFVAFKGDGSDESFYFGVPLAADGGGVIGSLLVFASHPSCLSQREVDCLRRIGRQIVQLLEADYDREKVRQDLQESQYLYETSINAIQEGYTVVDRRGVVLNCNAAVEQMLQVSADELIGKKTGDGAYNFVDSDGGALLRTKHPAWLALKSGRTQSKVIGVINGDNPIAWLQVSACPLFHPGESEPYGAVQIFHDVTEQRTATLDLKKSEERLREAQRIAGIGCWEIDVTNQVYWLSEEMLKIYELDQSEEPRVEYLRSRVHPHDLELRDSAVQNCLAHGQPFDFDMRIQFPNGRFKWCHCVGKPSFDSSGRVVKMSGTMMDITTRKLTEQQLLVHTEALAQQKEELELANKLIQGANQLLRSLVVEDGMTGLKNHRAFQETIADEVVRAKRQKNVLSLLMLDVDHFKAYNDTYGHPEGDVILQKIAELITLNKRETDIAARYGGEEFAVILPDTDAEGAMVIAERIRTAVESASWLRTMVTVSMGICTLSAGITCAHEMIAAADKALYDSKSGGRNKISVYYPEAD